MKDHMLEILSAFVDGEAVDPEALATALAAPGSQAALLDFARLRAAVARDDSRPLVALDERAEPRVGEPRSDAALRQGVPIAKRLAAAAVLALALFGAGRLAGWLPGPEPSPPRPQRILQFTAGVDWHEETKPQGGAR